MANVNPASFPPSADFKLKEIGARFGINKLFLCLLTAVAWSLTVAKTEGAVTYSLAGDFSVTTNGGSNLWSYGQDNVPGEPLQFLALTTKTRNANDLWGTDFGNPPTMWSDTTGYWGIGKNTSATVQNSSSGISWKPGEVLLRPKATDPFPGRLVIGWTAPSNLTVNVSCSFERAGNAGSVGYSMVKRSATGDAVLVTWAGQTSAGALTNFLAALDVLAGDRLFWRIDTWGPGVENDMTKALIEITGVPVTNRPVINVPPIGGNVQVGSTFIITVGGSGASGYLWYKDGALIPGAGDASYSVGAASTNDAGSYVVVLTNSFGSVTSAPTVLTVAPAGSQPPEPYPSLTPKQVFSGTLVDEENELKTNVLMLRFAASRNQLAADAYRPVYHFVSPESQLNDPNGLCFWQGRWHMFYQGYPPDEFPAAEDIPKRRQHWGHAVSTDLIHWRDLPYAIYPGIERMCFSGSTVAESNQVVAFYPGIAAGQMVAVANDPLLLNWNKLPECPVRSPSGDSCIWKEGDTYFGLVSADNLVSSTDLVNWTPRGAFLQGGALSLGDAAACPGFAPIGNKYILTSFSHTVGGQYLLGDYDQQSHKFTPYAMDRFNHGRVSPGGVHAPSVVADGQGGAINILNINDGKHSDDWDQIMSLAQQLTLGPDSLLRIAPVAAVSTLRGEHHHVGQTVLPANQEIVLNQIQGNAMELDVEIDPGLARWVRLNVLRSPNAEEQTSITFFNFDRALSYWYSTPGEVVLDGSRSSALSDVWVRPPERAIMQRGAESLRLRVFVDRSVVEVFVNERQYLAMRVYPGRADSIGISLQAQGQDAVLKSLDAWKMNPMMISDSVVNPGANADQSYTGQLSPSGATFARVSGPAWLTIHSDGSLTGTPGQFDAGDNFWVISATSTNGSTSLLQLQIPVIGTSLFAETFNRYIGNQNEVQWQSGLSVAYNGNVPGWIKSGGGAVHAVDRASLSGQSNPVNWAPMLWQDNIITSPAIVANALGHTYHVAFETSPAVYSQSPQATQTGDGLLIQVLRDDNSVLASHTNLPGAWAGNMAFAGDGFDYLGDGSGDIKLRIGPAGSLASGSFQGAIDNVVVTEANISQQAFHINQLTVDPVADTLSISWKSAQGMRYDLVSQTNLAAPVATWPTYKITNLMGAPPENTIQLSPIPKEARRFFSLKAYPDSP